jgi:hypothetical protein
VKHVVLGNLIEVIIKYLSSIVIGQYTMEENNDKDIDKLLSAISLRTCSLEQWNSVLKKILK